MAVTRQRGPGSRVPAELVELVDRISVAIGQCTIEMEVGGEVASVVERALEYRRRNWEPFNGGRADRRRSRQVPSSLVEWLRPRDLQNVDERWFGNLLAQRVLVAEEIAYEHAIGAAESMHSRVLLGRLSAALVPLFAELNAPRALRNALQREHEAATRILRPFLTADADTSKSAQYRFIIPAVLSFLEEHGVQPALQTEFLECVLPDMDRGTLRNRVSRLRAQRSRIRGRESI